MGGNSAMVQKDSLNILKPFLRRVKKNLSLFALFCLALALVAL